jgi:hypothetical protein
MMSNIFTVRHIQQRWTTMFLSARERIQYLSATIYYGAIASHNLNNLTVNERSHDVL